MQMTGNNAVDAMGKLNISGNITPHIWYKTILRPSNGKPYLLAIAILSDIVYWYRPSEIRDETTGQVIGWKKKFRGDALQKSYQNYAEMFGESKRTIRDAMDVLCNRGVIEREFRKISMNGGTVANNVMFIRLCVDILYDLTFPNVPDEAAVSVIGMEKMEGDHIRRISIGYGENLPEGMEEIRIRSPQKNVTGPTEFFRTNTENFTENFSENRTKTTISPIRDYEMAVEEAGRLLRQNINFDALERQYAKSRNDELVREIFRIMCDVVSRKGGKCNIGGSQIPNEVVKDRLLKLTTEHVNYVLQHMLNSDVKVNNMTAYLTSVLFNSLNVMDIAAVNAANYDLATGAI